MKVYIEYVILNNFFVDIMILYLVAILRHKQIALLRLIISSIIGTIYSVFLPYISFKGDVFLKIALSLIMMLIAFKVHSIKEYFINICIFYLITFMLGGVVIGIGNSLNSDFINVLLYPNSLVPMYISLIVLILTIIAKYTIYVCQILTKRKKYYYDVRISFKNKISSFKGYLDTGNTLYYNLNKVIILDKKVFDNTIGKERCSDIISINTINEKSIENIYKLDFIDIIQNKEHKHYSDVYAIQSNREFNGYQVLLHRDM